MKKATIFLACAVLLGSAILSGCNKISGPGAAVRFSAVSKGLFTKTSYGDDSNGKQALNWENGDVIQIASPTATVTSNSEKNYADYVVTRTSTGVPSNGTISLNSNNANGLEWGDADSYTFYAIYPSTVSNSDITLTASSGAVSAKIPATPTLTKSSSIKTVEVEDDDITYTFNYTVYEMDMKYAYMTAAAEDVTNGNTVSLEFNPAFTAFEFNLSSDDEEFTVTKVELVGDGTDRESADDDVMLAGTFTMTAGADVSSENAVTVGTATKSVSATIDNAVMSVTTDDDGNKTSTGISFTLFTLPKDNADYIYLKVTVSTGEVATLPLSTLNSNKVRVPYVFKAGQKYRINLLKLASGWYIFYGDLTVDAWKDGGSTSLIVE